MTPYIVDSSVAIKWYVPELLAAEAARLQTSGAPLEAPDFIDIELMAVCWKKIRRGDITRQEGDFVLSRLPVMPLSKQPTGPLVGPAFDLAVPTGRTVYDCLYLALAVRLNGQMVTADDRLVNALANTPWAGHALRLADVP